MIRSKIVIVASLISFFLLSLFLYRTTPTSKSCFDIDSTGYDRIGLHFSQTGRLEDPNDPHNATVQTVGYHFFVGVMYKIFGHNYFPIIFFQILLTVLSCFLTFLIARYFFGKAVALIALLLCVVNIGFLVYPQLLLAESLVLTMILFFVERFLAYLRSQNLIHIILSGFVGGISVLVKPSALFFLLFLALLLLLCDKKKIHSFLLFSLFCSIPVFGYLMYNKVQYGYFNLAPMKSLNMYHVFLSKVIAQVHGISVQEAEKRIPHFSANNSLDERGWNGARKLFWKYAFEHPGACFFVWTKNVSKTMFGLFSTQLKVLLSPAVKGGDVSFYKYRGSPLVRAYHYITQGSSCWVVTFITFLEALWTLVRYVLVFFAFLFLLRKKRYGLVAFFFAYFFCFSFITGFDGCCRYRILFEPMLIILSALPFVLLGSFLKGVSYEPKSFCSL